MTDYDAHDQIERHDFHAAEVRAPRGGEKLGVYLCFGTLGLGLGVSPETAGAAAYFGSKACREEDWRPALSVN